MSRLFKILFPEAYKEKRRFEAWQFWTVVKGVRFLTPHRQPKDFLYFLTVVSAVMLTILLYAMIPESPSETSRKSPFGDLDKRR